VQRDDSVLGVLDRDRPVRSREHEPHPRDLVVNEGGVMEVDLYVNNRGTTEDDRTLVLRGKWGMSGKFPARMAKSF
jgi:hypothetical protein